jgi:metal-sulfur cluster biosynthetic enzyme
MKTMDPEIIKRIDAVLDRVKDPVSGLSVSQLGIVKRVRYNEEKNTLYVFTDFQSHMPECRSCAFIARDVAERIARDLIVEFHLDFPGFDVIFV